MNILVNGWFGAGNIGDELFKEAFHTLFPQYDFTFVNQITKVNLAKADAVFIGGGSFLQGDPKLDDCLELLTQKKLFYIGVGVETDIHATHQKLMQRASLIAIRTPQCLDKIQLLNKNVICIPDLVYSLQSKVKSSDKTKSVLVIPNLIVVPCWSDPHWKHSSWDYFKSEFAQFLDELAEAGNNIGFLSMCKNKYGSDEWAAAEILNKMKQKPKTHIVPYGNYSLSEVTSIISQYQSVVTQRFHGIVLAEMASTPYISLYHHDKLKTAYPSRGSFLSYYGLYKQKLHEEFNSINKKDFSSNLLIEPNIFDSLVAQVKQIIGD